MKTLMFYELAPDGLAKVPALFAAHTARLQAFHTRGVLLMAGPYGQPPIGALAVFSSDEAAREFIDGDPFVKEGAVSKWQLQPWKEALA
jgi:uncharacterized protein YciI